MFMLEAVPCGSQAKKAGTHPQDRVPALSINMSHLDLQNVQADYQHKKIRLIEQQGTSIPDGTCPPESLHSCLNFLVLSKSNACAGGASSKTITRSSVGLKRLRFPSWPFSCLAVAGKFPFGRTITPRGVHLDHNTNIADGCSGVNYISGKLFLAHVH
jgi:hypothetical protein